MKDNIINKWIKSFLLLFILVFVTQSAFAELRTIDTKYFSIVYESTSSEKSAQFLAHHADSIADEVCAYFKVKSEKSRLPIFLKPYEENLNGYYTSSPYRHIVIYDTLPTDNVLANNTENLLSVFKHEYTHAVTMNSIFALTFPLAMREGMAVLSESVNGEGRLNDEATLQIIKQAKIDGKEIRWNDIDMRDTYPTGKLGYIYGGAFSKFLTEVYGVEKYAAFLKMHPKWFTTRNFKLAFGKSINELFANFIDTISIPENIVEPNYFLNTEKVSLYGATASWKDKLALFDKNENAVFLYDANTLKRQKLFSINRSVYHLAFSKDGNFLAVSLFKSKNGGTVSEVSIYDVKRKKFLSEKYTSLRYASFTDDAQSLVAVRSISQNAALVLVNRTTKEESVKFACSHDMTYTNIYETIAVSDNTYACVAGNGVNRDIVFVSADGKIEKLKLPVAAKSISGLTNIHSQAGAFSFSYILDNSLVRMAYGNYKTKSLYILDKDISGGTNTPAFIERSENGKEAKRFVTVSRHLDYDALCTLDQSEMLATSYATEAIEIKPLHTPEPDFASKPYNPIMKMWVPSISPYFSIGTAMQNTSYGLKFSSQDVINRLFYSFAVAIMPVPTFAQIEFTGGLNLKGNTLSLSVYDTTKVIKNQLNGIRSTGFGFKNKNTVMSKNTAIAFDTSINSTWFAPIDLTLKNVYKQKYTDTVIAASQAVSVSNFINRERLRSGFFAKDTYGVGNDFQVTAGYNVQKQITAVQVQDLLTLKMPVLPLTLQLAGSVGYNARLNPITGTYSFENSLGSLAESYLPTMAEHSTFYQKQSAEKFNYAVGGKATLRVFSVEIQKGSAWLPICYNRFNIDIGYKSVFNKGLKGKMEFLQSVFTDLSVSISGVANIGFSYSHPIVKGAKIGAFSLLFNLEL